MITETDILIPAVMEIFQIMLEARNYVQGLPLTY